LKDSEGRWLRRKSAIEVVPSRPTSPTPANRRATSGPAPSPKAPTASGLRQSIRSTAFAFRGFDVENVGRSAELLDHPVFGPIVSRVLLEASELCSESIHARVDLASHIRAGARTSLDFFPQDVATIVATELAQMTVLEECFGVPAREARLAFGYSIGELSALVWTEVFDLEQLLPIPLGLARDCAELANDLTMGVLFTRGPALPMDEVERLCRGISSEGHGLIGPSAFLSPNTALILGQGETINRLDAEKGALKTHKAEKVSLRRNANRWPPLHSPLVWQRHIPDRTAMALYQIQGGRTRPTPTLLSCVTGAASYDVENTRELLTDWTDHPQRLWDVIDRTLAMGVETVIHVGPRPNLIPATFSRLANNVKAHLGNKYMRMLGRGVASGLGRHSWLNRVLPSSTALLRAPFLNHVILEDWLLEQPLPSVRVSLAGTTTTTTNPIVHQTSLEPLS
jgi:[acyl-carrier-protein] S-malonyltransferase